VGPPFPRKNVHPVPRHGAEIHRRRPGTSNVFKERTTSIMATVEELRQGLFVVVAAALVSVVGILFQEGIAI